MSSPKRDSARFFAALPSALAGGLTALAVVVMVQPREPERPSTEGIVAKQSGAAQRPPARLGAIVNSWDNRRRIASLERRISATSRGDAESGDGPGEPDDRAGDREPEPELEREALFAAWGEKLEAHRTDVVDAAWAAQVAARLEADFYELMDAESGDEFERVSLDCRTSTCVASIGFASFDDARRQFSRLLRHRYGIDCGVEVGMPPPLRASDASEPYTANVLFRCARSVKGDDRG